MIFFGGMLQILGAIGEWILGNTFSMCLFFTYGTFWIVAGTELIPWFGVGVHYSSNGSTLQGMAEPSYYATFGTFVVVFVVEKPVSFYFLLPPFFFSVFIFIFVWYQANYERETMAGFYYLSLALLTLIFTVCALRTNIVFFCALFTLVFSFACGAGAFWNLALGNVHAGEKLTVVCICIVSPLPHGLPFLRASFLPLPPSSFSPSTHYITHILARY